VAFCTVLGAMIQQKQSLFAAVVRLMNMNRAFSVQLGKQAQVKTIGIHKLLGNPEVGVLFLEILSDKT